MCEDNWNQALFDKYEQEARDSGLAFLDGNPIGMFVVICPNVLCGYAGRNPLVTSCPFCGAERVKTVDFLRSKQAEAEQN